MRRAYFHGGLEPSIKHVLEPPPKRTIGVEINANSIPLWSLYSCTIITPQKPFSNYEDLYISSILSVRQEQQEQVSQEEEEEEAAEPDE